MKIRPLELAGVENRVAPLGSDFVVTVAPEAGFMPTRLDPERAHTMPPAMIGDPLTPPCDHRLPKVWWTASMVRAVRPPELHGMYSVPDWYALPPKGPVSVPRELPQATALYSP